MFVRKFSPPQIVGQPAVTRRSAQPNCGCTQPNALCAVRVSLIMSPHHNLFPAVKIKYIASDVVLGLGPWLSLRTKFQSLVLSLALRLESLVLALALRVKSLLTPLHRRSRDFHRVGAPRGGSRISGWVTMEGP